MPEQIDLHAHETAKNITHQLKKQKFYDTVAIIAALVGWIWEYSQYEKYYVDITYRGYNSDGDFTILFRNEAERPFLTLLRVGVTLTTILLRKNSICALSNLIFQVYMIYCRYQTEIELIILRRGLARFARVDENGKLLEDPKKSLRRSKYRWMAIEMLILAAHSLPHVNANFDSHLQGEALTYRYFGCICLINQSTNSLDIIMFVIMSMRIYLLPRLLRHYLKWMSEDAVAVCKTQGTSANIAFGFKAFRKEHPLIVISILLVILMFLAGFTMRAFERPYEVGSGLDWGNYFNSIWCTFAIITTVGYGDFYPKTTAGRVIAVLACFAGQFFVSLIVTTITNMVEFSDPQNRAYKKMTSLDLKMRLEVARSNMIKFYYLYYKDRHRKREPDYVETFNKYYTKFMINLNAYKAARKEISCDIINTPVELIIDDLKHKFQERKFDMLKVIRSKINKSNARIDELERKYEQIDNEISELEKYNLNILHTFEKIEQQTTHRFHFDRLTRNPRVLNNIDDLAHLNAPVSRVHDPYFNAQTLLKKTESMILDETKKRRITSMFQRAAGKIDHDLIEIEKEAQSVLPNIPLRHKRAIANNPGAKDKFLTLIHLKQAVNTLSKRKAGYVSGDVIGKSILETKIEGGGGGEKSPTLLFGRVKRGDDSDEDDVTATTSLVLEAKKHARRFQRAKTLIGFLGKGKSSAANSPGIVDLKRDRSMPVKGTTRSPGNNKQTIYHTKGNQVAVNMWQHIGPKQRVFRVGLQNQQLVVSEVTNPDKRFIKKNPNDTSFEEQGGNSPVSEDLTPHDNFPISSDGVGDTSIQMDNAEFNGRKRPKNLTWTPNAYRDAVGGLPSPDMLRDLVGEPKTDVTKGRSSIKVIPVMLDENYVPPTKEPELNIQFAEPNQGFAKGGEFKYATKGDQAGQHRGFEGRGQIMRGFRFQTSGHHDLPQVVKQDSPIGSFTKNSMIVRQSYEEEKQVGGEINTAAHRILNNNSNINILNAQKRMAQTKGKDGKKLMWNDQLLQTNQSPPKESSIYTFETGLLANGQRIQKDIISLDSSGLPSMTPIPLVRDPSSATNKSQGMTPILRRVSNLANIGNNVNNANRFNAPTSIDFYENYDEEDNVSFPASLVKDKTPQSHVNMSPGAFMLQQPESIDSSLSLTEFKKEVMKVEPTLGSNKNLERSIFRNPNHINQILGSSPLFQPSTKNQFLTTFPPKDQKPKVFKGVTMTTTEIERLNSDGSDAANDPTIAQFKDALDKAIEREESSPQIIYNNNPLVMNPKFLQRKNSNEIRKNMGFQTHNGSMLSILNGLDKATDSNTTSFTLPPNTKLQYQNSDFNQSNHTRVYDLGGGNEDEDDWDLDGRYDLAMQQRWNSQKGVQGAQGGLRPVRGSIIEDDESQEYDIYKNYSNDNSVMDNNQRERGSINKGNQRDILDYFK